MIPMLRVLASAVPTSVVTSSLSGLSSPLMRWRGLPAVVGECLVRLRHLVGVFPALHAGAESVACVEQLVHQALGHRLLAALPAVGDEPAQCERRAAARLDLYRDLVGRATDAAALDLDLRLDVVERALERHDRVRAGLVAAAFEGVV